ncbi:MAG: hypothetical protein BGO13_10910 [Burkholderiales bacterium 66-5]|nr:MAG: hypothetical protein BGO13_10910 [Burkholderiales bacterium 66-5]
MQKALPEGKATALRQSAAHPAESLDGDEQNQHGTTDKANRRCLRSNIRHDAGHVDCISASGYRTSKSESAITVASETIAKLIHG